MIDLPITETNRGGKDTTENLRFFIRENAERDAINTYEALLGAKNELEKAICEMLTLGPTQNVELETGTRYSYREPYDTDPVESIVFDDDSQMYYYREELPSIPWGKKEISNRANLTLERITQSESGKKTYTIRSADGYTFTWNEDGHSGLVFATDTNSIGNGAWSISTGYKDFNNKPLLRYGRYVDEKPNDKSDAALEKLPLFLEAVTNIVSQEKQD